MLTMVAIEVAILVFTIFLWRNWWARILFPLVAASGIWGTYRQLGESQEVTLTPDAFKISKYHRGRPSSTAECKPWFLTNVRYRKRGHNKPSSITCDVEARFNRFAEGIKEHDAYSVFYALLNSGFLPNPDELHFP